MFIKYFNNQPKAMALMLALIVTNIVAWGTAFYLFHTTPSLMAASLLAWCYGLRHAVDADHIAAIDNVTRKMMQQGKRPCGIGAWFSLGHSTIVVLASIRRHRHRLQPQHGVVPRNRRHDRHGGVGLFPAGDGAGQSGDPARRLGQL